MEFRKIDLQLLEAMIDTYSLQSVLSALSYICSERSVRVATEHQDTASAKGWMSQAKQLDNLVAKWEGR